MVTVNELRIGSHILAGGVRARVIDIHKKCLETENYPYQVFVEGISPDDGEKKVVGGLSDNLEPIPLTAELLEELGFVKYYPNVYGKEFGGEYFSQTIKVSDPIGVCSSVYGVSYQDDDNHNYDVGCRYLHELEAFVYLTTKQELIKED